MGRVVTWVAWVCELRGSNVYVGCMGYVGQNIFYVGHHFMWVVIFTWVAWVKYTFAWVKLFLGGSKFFCVGLFMGQKILRGSNNFCSGQFLGVSLKKIWIGPFTNILVAH